MAKQTDETTEPTMASVMDKLANIALANNSVQREQLKQTKRRSNQFAPLTSPMNYRGEKDYPMAPLKCPMYIPHKVDEANIGGLTREEVDLLNLVEPGDYFIEMNDGDRQAVCVVGYRSSTTNELYRMDFMGPRDEEGKHTGLFTHDRRNRFPSFRMLLRQILGEKADGVMTMAEEKRRVRLPETDPQHLPISIGE